MKRTGIDMWVVLAREYNEDPVYKTLIPYLQRTASRLSGLVFYLDSSDVLECLSISRPSPTLEKFYKGMWDSNTESQWESLNRIISERNPKNIGINTSKDYALADGLSQGLYELLHQNLSIHQSKIVSAEKLCIGWLETRSQLELKKYHPIYNIVIDIIEEAFSSRVITPNKTTTDEVQWWIMQRINDLGLEAWFTPTVDLQRKGIKENRISNTTITHGDILHCDVGIKYLGLSTDTQRVAYVLHPNETEVPRGIKAALSNCNDFQDIVAENFVPNRTGNEIFTSSMEEAKKLGMKAMLYTHPIGYHGHGIGPIIGLWDNQGVVPVRGDYPLYHDTCYALELNAQKMYQSGIIKR
ncbi:M24 family metallopeptidase [Alkalicella caledoniensis]|uniref:M24 family metallopeptidase n=1 Tax=Alkalicella caledoniensis TaxID=2731377 RepID=A0A7G9W9X6_ALKCA|nr:M24 family metallopeptidase [Alkalicella caledoniensis]QNO15488.1 M24 family metallopeptidase [Alkalicella caledoniensis]